MVEIENKQNIQVKAKNRMGNPNWYKGMKSPNPKGNTHTKDIAGLIAALEDRSKRGGYKNFDALVADRAAQYETVLIAVMKKIYPEQPATLIDQSQHKETHITINKTYEKEKENLSTNRIYADREAD